jgi:iron complex outermembrane recepter protein
MTPADSLRIRSLQGGPVMPIWITLADSACSRYLAGGQPHCVVLFRRSLFVGLLFLLLTAVPLRAQNASVSGVVTDALGAAIGSATVEITDINTRAKSVTKSNQEGLYEVQSLRPGTYSIVIAAPGFSPHTRSAVVLTAGQALTHDIQLAIASFASEVNVVATIVSIPDTPVSVGPLMGKTLSDLPYSVVILPQELIENQQATSLRELIKYMPSVQIEERGGSDVGRPQTRGLEGTVSANSRIDGLNMVATTAYPMEQFERLEVLNGLSGTLNGPAQPAGSFNFVLKRPTATPYRRVMLKYDNQNSPTVAVDLGDSLGENKSLGYRLNLLYGDGQGFVDESNLKRWLGSLSLDFRLRPNTVLEANYSYYRFDKRGFPGGFSYGPTITLPEAPDPSTVGYGASWGGSVLDTRTSSVRVRHTFNQNWHLLAGVLDQWAQRGFLTPTNTLLNNAGDYRSSVSVGPAGRHEVTSNMAYVNGRFRTGRVSHEVALGNNGHQWRGGPSGTNRNVVLGTASLANPVSWTEPDLSKSARTVPARDPTNQQALMGVDTLTFSNQWSAIVSVAENWLWSPGYDRKGVSYGARVLFKPRQRVTIYYTNADSLQQGDIAPDIGVANPGEILEPYRSSSHEVGIKAPISVFSVNLAVFRIERPFSFADPVTNVFKVLGNQVNYGLELMATGEVFSGLTAYGGVTYLNPRLLDTGRATTTDKQVVGVPKTQANLLLEYTLPVLPRLAVNANLHHTSKRPANDTNTSWAAGYQTVDLGARYTLATQSNLSATLRLEVDNVTDTQYWASIFPGSINGISGNYSAFIGVPRTVMASMQVGF